MSVTTSLSLSLTFIDSLSFCSHVYVCLVGKSGVICCVCMMLWDPLSHLNPFILFLLNMTTALVILSSAYLA